MDRSEAFGVLASADRQYLLDELLARNGARTVGELSRRVAARRHRTTREDVSDAAVERARVRLVHVHVPRLLERDVVDVDREENTVVLEEAAADPLLDAAAELPEWPPEPKPNRSK
jgi:hypothetical protein